MLRNFVLVAAFCCVWPTVANGQNRSADGTGNNIDNPLWGATNTQLPRVMPNDYVDGIGNEVLSEPLRANPREISNAVVAQAFPEPNSRGLTNFVWQWGQFIDHDVSLTEADAANGMASIPVPSGDVLAPGPIPFSRSNFDPDTSTSMVNPRQQINQITSYIDASNVYGSDSSRAKWLRTGLDGRLKTSAPGMLPYNDGTMANAGTPEQPDLSTELFVAGDIRCNEQVGLTAMHTLFVREHNRLASRLQPLMSGASDEDIYQTARRIVNAETQIITYREFLPALLGDIQLPAYAGYQTDVDASVATEFSTAFYRFGHTMLPPELTLVEPGGSTSSGLALRDAFFTPEFFDDPLNVDRVLGGLITLAQEIDAQLVDDVRSFLFGPAGSGGLDLASLNIQRGRDHGLPDYNSLRQAYGLLPKEQFLTDGVLADGMTPNGVTTDDLLAASLETMYGSVDNIDAWMGGLAEDPLDGAAVSEVVAAALVDQFTRSRDGDRFFYLRDPLLETPEIAAVIDLDTINLRQIIELNTLARFSTDNLFVVPEPTAWGLLLLFGCGLCARNRRW